MRSRKVFSMVTRNNMLLPIMVLSLLIIASCTPQRGPDNLFEGGREALLFSFLHGTPPELVHDNSAMSFDIILNVENAGEFDIDKIHFTLSGIGSDFSGGTYFTSTNTPYGWIRAGPGSNLGTTVLPGKTKFSHTTFSGGTAIIPIVEGLQYSNKLLGGGPQQHNIRIDACYPYATVATSTACYQRNYNDGDDTACSPNKDGELSVSGAPLQITGYTQTPIGPGNLQVQYTFEITSNAKIWAPKKINEGSWQNCTPTAPVDRIREEGVFYVEIDHQEAASNIRCVEFHQPDIKDLNGVHIKEIEQPALTPTSNAVRISEVQTRPNANGYLKLQNGKATLTCTLTLNPTNTNYMGTINIASTYYVHEFIGTSFKVTHSGT